MHGGFGQEAQQLGGAVAAHGEFEQLGRFFDEARGDLAGGEGRMVDHVFQELQIGGHTADAELAQRAVHALARLNGRGCPCGDLHQQRVVIRGDHGAGVGGAAIQPNAEAGRAAVGGEAAVVGQEAVFRVFGGHAALQRVAAQRNVGLQRHTRGVAAVLGFLVDANEAAFADADLGAHDVDPGDQLGHGVLHLDARVHLDEVALVVVGVHQKLHRAGVGVVHRAHQGQRAFAQLGPRCGIEVGRGRALHHLLVAPLHRAIALVQVHGVAVQVAQDLHFHMARAADEFFEIHLVVAKGGQRFAARGFQRAFQLGSRFDHAHAAPTAAPAGLQHHRETNAFGQALTLGQVERQRRRGRHHRHTGGHRRVARGHLVAQGAHHIAAGADPAEAGGHHGIGKVGVF